MRGCSVAASRDSFPEVVQLKNLFAPLTRKLCTQLTAAKTERQQERERERESALVFIYSGQKLD